MFTPHSGWERSDGSGPILTLYRSHFSCIFLYTKILSRANERCVMIPATMKASIYENYGDADVLKYAEVPTPVPGRDEALVKVHAVGLNGYDLMARAGRYKPNKGK